MSDQTYNIPAMEITAEQNIKKSRFIAHISQVDDKVSAKKYIQSIREQYPDARHHCWAFIAGPPNTPTELGMSDDGEPQGTAGKPIFNILKYSGIGEVCAVVVRYFGGIKLGTGGLVRAYSSTLQLALEQLTFELKQPMITMELSFDYRLEDCVRRHLQELNFTPEDCHYNNDVKIVITIPKVRECELRKVLDSASNAQINIICVV